MSKILLFVCLALFGTVLGQTQMRFIHAQYSGLFKVGITTDLAILGNTTLTDGLLGTFDTAPEGPFHIPHTSYVALPKYEFEVGTEIDLQAFDRDYNQEAPIESAFVSLINVTLVELQSYSLVYVAETEDVVEPRTSSPSQLFLVEERPNPSPVGKAALRIFNAALSTYSPATNATIDVKIGEVIDRTVVLAFGEASEFIEYATAGAMKLEMTLPGSTQSVARTIDITTEIGYTTMVYIRGDITTPALYGSRVNNVQFAFPEPPSAPVAPPTAPVAAPTATEPNAAAPVAAPVAAPTATPTRAPTRRVSSASVAVAQIAGVACVMALLF